jgi:hypothetical protein
MTFLNQLINTIPRYDSANARPLNCALATLRDIAPKDAFERLLAVQMVGVHQLTMEYLRHSAAPLSSIEETNSLINAANKLARTFTMQMEALNRHRGKGSQPVVVGNVNVSDGGQAIVGAVNRTGSEKGPNSDDEQKLQ